MKAKIATGATAQIREHRVAAADLRRVAGWTARAEPQVIGSGHTARANCVAQQSVARVGRVDHIISQGPLAVTLQVEQVIRPTCPLHNGVSVDIRDHAGLVAVHVDAVPGTTTALAHIHVAVDIHRTCQPFEHVERLVVRRRCVHHEIIVTDRPVARWTCTPTTLLPSLDTVIMIVVTGGSVLEVIPFDDYVVRAFSTNDIAGSVRGLITEGIVSDSDVVRQRTPATALRYEYAAPIRPSHILDNDEVAPSRPSAAGSCSRAVHDDGIATDAITLEREAAGDISTEMNYSARTYLCSRVPPVAARVEKRCRVRVGARRSIARTGGALCNVNVVGKANSAEKENRRDQQNEPRRVAHAQSIAGYLPSLVAVRHGEENVATRPHLSQLVMGTAEVQDACLYSTLPQFQAGTAHIGSRKQQLSARTRLELGKKTLLKGTVARES